MALHHLGFAEIWLVFFNLVRRPGDRFEPQCLVARELVSTRDIVIERPALLLMRAPPYPVGAHSLFVTFEANRALGCHLRLGWPVPQRVIDLRVEFRNLTNGRTTPCGTGLVGALIWFGLGASGVIGAGSSLGEGQRTLAALQQLLSAMESTLDGQRALLRGRYMAAVARMEAAGAPIDAPLLGRLTRHWQEVRRRLGARASEAQPGSLAVGDDGRHRAPLRPFRSRTGRNQPSSHAFLFAGPRWFRHLVRPDPGMGLALIDWAQQEFGIAAALSGDSTMRAAYQSGDPYLAFARQANAVPTTGTPETHPLERKLFKACALGVQYGMGAKTLAQLTRTSEPEAQALLSSHRRTYPTFWQWSDAVVDSALLRGQMSSVFGWLVKVDAGCKPGFVRNFPMQSNGAEMLRLACSLVTEAGITVCAPLHDALLIEAPIDALDDAVKGTRKLMAEASAIVLDDFELRSEFNIVRYPHHIGSANGESLWREVECILGEYDARTGSGRHSPAHQRDETCPPTSSRPISLYVSKEDLPDASD